MSAIATNVVAVPRATRGTGHVRKPCSLCKKRPRRDRQRTCQACHRASMRDCRARKKLKLRAMAWELAELRTRVQQGASA